MSDNYVIGNAGYWHLSATGENGRGIPKHLSVITIVPVSRWVHSIFLLWREKRWCCSTGCYDRFDLRVWEEVWRWSSYITTSTLRRCSIFPHGVFNADSHHSKGTRFHQRQKPLKVCFKVLIRKNVHALYNSIMCAYVYMRLRIQTCQTTEMRFVCSNVFRFPNHSV